MCVYIHISPYVYSIPTCANFDLRRTFQNVTTAQVGVFMNRGAQLFKKSSIRLKTLGVRKVTRF